MYFLEIEYVMFIGFGIVVLVWLLFLKYNIFFFLFVELDMNNENLRNFDVNLLFFFIE